MCEPMRAMNPKPENKKDKWDALCGFPKEGTTQFSLFRPKSGPLVGRWWASKDSIPDLGGPYEGPMICIPGKPLAYGYLAFQVLQAIYMPTHTQIYR